MPYAFVSTKVRLETTPCTVGDEGSDPGIMEYLGAQQQKVTCSTYTEYIVDKTPREVLDLYEKIGYHVISMTGVGQTCIWCLYKASTATEQAQKVAQGPAQP